MIYFFKLYFCINKFICLTLKSKKMKAKVLALFMLLSIGSSLNVSGMEVCYADSNEKEDVALDRDKGNSWGDGNGPRAQDIFLLTCHYEDEVVYLNFLADVGLVKLTVTNLTTSDSWTATQLSTLGSLYLQTSINSGNYMVEIETELDGNYIGYFTK